MDQIQKNARNLKRGIMMCLLTQSKLLEPLFAGARFRIPLVIFSSNFKTEPEQKLAWEFVSEEEEETTRLPCCSWVRAVRPGCSCACALSMLLRCWLC
jgi:hypothetical protein